MFGFYEWRESMVFVYFCLLVWYGVEDEVIVGKCVVGRFVDDKEVVGV